MEALHEEEEEEKFNHERCSSGIIKGKRTKRPRQSSTSTSSTTSGEMSLYSSEEDQDMANCLILLAQGIRSPPENRVGEQGDLLDSDSDRKKEKINSDSYECKTCNRAFQSFQALGGHRASHKKPKITPTPTTTNTQEKQSSSLVVVEYDHNQKVEIKEEKEIELKMKLISKISSSNTTTTTTQSNKVHECSICGAEFSSGQALGGHMRRHRSPAPAPAPAPANSGKLISYSINQEDEQKKKNKNKNKNRNMLQLDLNLPAPIEDDKFQYISPTMVFSGPTLVGCHY